MFDDQYEDFDEDYVYAGFYMSVTDEFCDEYEDGEESDEE